MPRGKVDWGVCLVISNSLGNVCLELGVFFVPCKVGDEGLRIINI